MHRRSHHRTFQSHIRRGNATLDYILILSAMLPIVLFIVVKGKRTMQLIWEMLCILVSWPLM